MNAAWTEAEDAVLREAWADGFSCSQIGLRLRRTRNSVIGRKHRLKLPDRATAHTIRPPRNTRPKLYGMRQTGPQFSTPPKPLPPPNDKDIPTISMEGLESHHCRWPCTDGGHPLYALRFCGAPKIPGFSYCHHHAIRAHNAPNPSRPTTPAAAPVPVLEAA